MTVKRAAFLLLALASACGGRELTVLSLPDAADLPPDAGGPADANDGGVLPIRGWDDPPGTGRAFVIDSLAFSPDPHAGQVFSTALPNALGSVLGPLVNDQVRQGLLAGESLMLFEVAGLIEPYQGQDQSVTIKFYGAVDAQSPANPANDFLHEPGDPDACCRFEISAASIAGPPPQARARAPAQIRNGVLETIAVLPLEWPFTVFRVGTQPYTDIRVEHSMIRATVAPDLSSLSGGALAGAVPIHVMAEVQNPACTQSSTTCPPLLPGWGTLLDLIVAQVQPDIDLDADGDFDSFRRDVLGNGRVKQCTHQGMDVPPLSADQPWTCALQPDMGDGFSTALDFHAVAAQVLGVAP
jgi:hypothetical protein